MLFSTDAIDPQDYIALKDLRDVSTALQNAYYGELIFFLAHEQGHVVLGHFSANAPDSPGNVRAKELDADRYAVLVTLSEIRNEAGPNASIWPPEVTEALGYHAFFEHAYTLAGFDAVDGADRSGYPSKEERIQSLADAERRFSNLLWQEESDKGASAKRNKAVTGIGR